MVRVECVFYGAARCGPPHDLGRGTGQKYNSCLEFPALFLPLFIAFLCPSLVLMDLWLYLAAMFNLWTPILWYLGHGVDGGVWKGFAFWFYFPFLSAGWKNGIFVLPLF